MKPEFTLEEKVKLQIRQSLWRIRCIHDEMKNSSDFDTKIEDEIKQLEHETHTQKILNNLLKN